MPRFFFACFVLRREPHRAIELHHIVQIIATTASAIYPVASQHIKLIRLPFTK
jgi:hypothetical protein